MKLCTWLQNATAWTKIKVWWRPVVLQKNGKLWENSETLQLAAEWHSMNKNQRFIKIKPVDPMSNAKNWETLQLAAEYHSMNKNQRLIKIRPVVPEKNAKKVRKFWNFTIGCRVAQHKQKSNIYQDQTSSSSKKCKNVKKILKVYNWL